MNTIPGMKEAGAPPFTEVDFQFESLPQEVQVRILAQHCRRLLQDNDTLEAENKYLREKNAQLKQDKTYQVKGNQNLRLENEKLMKDLRLYRKFVKSNSVVGIFNTYCRSNARNK